MCKENLYSVLEVNQSASRHEIRQKYIELVKIHHPDKFNGDDEKIKNINYAYSILRDSEVGRLYDLWLTYQDIIKSTNIEKEKTTIHDDESDMFLQSDFFVYQKYKFIVLVFLVSLLSLIAGISDINNFGARDLMIGGAFAIYFIILITLLEIA